MGNFKQIIAKLNMDYDKVVEEGTQDSYARLAAIFEELGKYLRGDIQEKTAGRIFGIIKKLKSGGPVSTEDYEHLRLWVVGDADYFAKLQNNFEDWKIQLKRLMNAISEFQVDDPDIDASLKLRGLFRDGVMVLADITYFLEQKDRMEKFTATMQGLNDEERVILIRILEQKMKSPDF